MSFGVLTTNHVSRPECPSQASHLTADELKGLDATKRNYHVYKENDLVWIDETALSFPPRSSPLSTLPLSPPPPPQSLAASNNVTLQASPLTYLLYGRIFEDGRLEALASFRKSPRLQFELSAMNAWQSSSSSIHAVLQHNSRLRDARSSGDVSGWFSELSYENMTDEGSPHWFGCRSAFHFPKSRVFERLKLSLGGELYYTAKEKSGGVSLGLRAVLADKANTQAPSSVVTLTANPIMGHLSSSYVQQASPHLLLAAKYDFNMYSFESDLAFGMELHSFPMSRAEQSRRCTLLPPLPCTEALPASSIKLRVGLSQGISLQFSSQLTESLHVKVGAASELKLVSPKTTIGMEISC